MATPIKIKIAPLINNIIYYIVILVLLEQKIRLYYCEVELEAVLGFILGIGRPGRLRLGSKRVKSIRALSQAFAIIFSLTFRRSSLVQFLGAIFG